MTKRTKQLSYWQGEFGDEYIKRNSDLSFFDKRREFFAFLFEKKVKIASVLEIGCNIGGNLYILHSLNPKLKIAGIEPNLSASESAKKLLPKASIYNLSVSDMYFKDTYDLVFTSGVLIHISNAEIKKAMEKIYTAARRYILSIEYYSKSRKTIPYRSLTDALFKRPYYKEWISLYPRLKLLGKGILKNDQGFDNCNWWLFEK